MNCFQLSIIMNFDIRAPNFIFLSTELVENGTLESVEFGALVKVKTKLVVCLRQNKFLFKKNQDSLAEIHSILIGFNCCM